MKIFFAQLRALASRRLVPGVSAGEKNLRTRWERISLGAGHVIYRMAAKKSVQSARIPWKGLVVMALALLLLIALGRV